MNHGIEWPHLKEIPLADPEFMANDPIELLFGAEVCSFILQEGLRKGGPRAPVAQNTLLGWIVSGGCDGATTGGRHPLTPSEQRCEDIFVRSHQRTADGRYAVRLPFASWPTTFLETHKSAEHLLTVMERRCDRDPRFGELYHTFLREYEELDHMELLQDSQYFNAQRCYLPHHGVLRESNTSTKLRVVFNGSQRTRSGESLNSQLLTGVNLLPSLADMLMRWRWHRYALVTDIEKMYRQIRVLPEDQDYQRILWRHSVADPV
ncbi:PREDICTED: uncharacterized protein LOC108781644 [Cyphomyrmex costatus]|uniref:uncharacterized protein LOC108781644 n=1 Tax=Cyphomyrmex costatus TaxID=456900 RepID=UPI0008522286|nr:PREDICTED: uncharacterized protein LOC108781644 [Cyphomyrmex costatus]